ncbi:hypothetical protein [Streptomyces sp. enrichment culture]|uniref:hypothetical protein n=1 Tax=Streptomyces sp. enrichment culture TaxID=1795815 RepID=UPI003F564673
MRRRGEVVLVFQLPRLHSGGNRAERAGWWRTVGARLLAGAAVLSGWAAAVLLVWRPGPAAHPYVLAAGGAGLGFGLLWAVALWRNARWALRGMVVDAGAEAPAVSGLDPVGDVPDWIWDTLRIANVMLMGIPVSGLVLLGLGASPAHEELRWGALVAALFLTALMGGIVGGLSVGLGAGGDDCWTPGGAARWLVVYGVPYLLAVPALAGVEETWSTVLVGLAALWLLIAPVNKVAKEIPGTAAD